VIPIRILLPVAMTVALFVGTIFLFILPILENRMMTDRREMVRELTETGWSVLSSYNEKEIGGQLTGQEARRQAIETLRGLRYGPEKKDYFWINDMHPHLLMHPYRPDLEGKDITGFSDPSGKRLFVEFVNAVQAAGAGYVDYQWQWKDDPLRIVPKISYVKGFAPWGWIVGTGIYVEDVRTEIAAITRRLTVVCLTILLLIVGLSGYTVWQSTASERRRRLADTALRTSEEKYRLLAETAREFILAFDPAGHISYANRAWLAASGFDPAAIRDMNIADILPVDERAAFGERLNKLLSEGTSEPLYAAHFLLKNGSRIPVEATLAALREGSETDRIFITARDVTERKKAEIQAQMHREQLFQADKMATLGTLVSGVAHEINNPVTFVMLNAPVLKQAWQAALPILDEHQRNQGDFKVGRMDYSRLRERLPLLVDNIIEGAERVKAIVGDLKDFARQGPDQMTDAVDINRSAAKAVSLVGNIIKKSTHHFEAQYAADIPTVAGNPRKIEQVVINLLVNACQALPDSGRTVRLSTAYDIDTRSVTIEVRDQGIGMPPEVLQRIRDPFFTTKRETGGTGLGLAIVDRIVDDHKGRLTFSSIVDQGTTVRVSLPLPPASASERGTTL
jgi:PAS domain S-box-containing protein